jgi:methionine-S-sulfoxide reductase
MTSLAVLVVAGGCFWGLEELFRQVPGVVSTRVGYTGGTKSNPTYQDVSEGKSGHAEAVEIKFDSNRINEDELLLKFFKFHDPTTLNQQGNDIGSQYRSALFYSSEEQRLRFQKIIDLVTKKNWWPKPIVTTLEKLETFYPAEEYHQKYLQKNPKGYTCHFERPFKD